MELSINIEYEQLVQLVKGLPYNQKKKLTREIEKDIKPKFKKKSKSNDSEEINEFQQFLLQGPLMSDEQYNDFKTTRNLFLGKRFLDLQKPLVKFLVTLIPSLSPE